MATPPSRKTGPVAVPAPEPSVDIVPILVSRKLLTAEQAERVRRSTRMNTAQTAEQAIVQLGFANEVQIAQTIAAHSEDAPARIAMKMNSLVDGRCIRALYEASQAGVRVDLNVRGICCLRPGLPGISENNRVVSIVGRLLEHSRVLAFERGGEHTIYIASADLMPRNLDHRVELAVPIESAELHAELLDTLERAFADNQNSWELDSEGLWSRRSPKPGEPPRSLQLELAELYAGRAREKPPSGEREAAAALTPPR